MPGGIQPAFGRKINERIFGTTRSRAKKEFPYAQHPRSRNINPDRIKPDDSGVGDFVRPGVNGPF